ASLWDSSPNSFIPKLVLAKTILKVSQLGSFQVTKNFSSLYKERSKLGNMFRPNQQSRDIIISKGGGGVAKGGKAKKKIIHPPIESYWLLPSMKPEKHSSSSSPAAAVSSMVSLIKRIGRSRSLNMALEGAHDPKDEDVVNSFREALFLDGHFLAKRNDYHTLLRFLRMRDFDIPKAKDMFVSYLKWREEYRVDAIAKEFKLEEIGEVKKCYPNGYHGVDRVGRPVYIERLGMVDTNGLLEATTLDRLVKYHISEQEKTMNLRYPACSIVAKTHIASTTSILDVKGVGMSSFSKPARYLFMEIQKIDSNYYPETLHRLYIVNAGSGFRMLWKVLKPFLDVRTLKKIYVLGESYKSELLEAVDASNLPSFLGGSCSCSSYGGCLFSDKGPWNNPEIQDLLQTLSLTEQAEIDAENTSLASEEALATPGRGQIDRRRQEEIREKVEKIQVLEAALMEANTKFEALERAMEDAKKVMKGLSQYIQAISF
ncbi:Phosphatidylinositol/phosphatidylcholine transfer protein SFH11, partial [Linum grandiflorum]